MSTETDRLYTAGYGIIDGFDSTINDNTISIKSGSAVDINGFYVEMQDTTISFENSVIFKIVEGTDSKLLVDSNGVITLSNIPYSLSRNCIASQETDKTKQGVIVSLTASSEQIQIVNIDANKITVDSKYNSSAVTVEYWYTKPRYDVVYISLENNNFVYETSIGTPSSIPVPIIPEGYSLLLKKLYIDPYYCSVVNGQTNYITKITQEDMTGRRKIYVDNNNDLYINNIAANDLCPIYNKEIDSLNINSLWYDNSEDTIKTLKEYDGINYWYPLNKANSSFAVDIKMWNPVDCPLDLQTFNFILPDELNLCYPPGTNSLSIIINNKILMSDQFDEIIDTSKPAVLQGVGFKLSAPLTEAAYVQVSICHNSAEANLSKIYQRSSIMRDSNDYKIDLISEQIFNTNACYSVGNKQLEVYIKGRRLCSDEFTEGIDLIDSLRINGALSNQFKILTPLNIGDTVSYVVDKNVFSYSSLDDSIKNMISDFENRINEKLKQILPS